VFPCQPVKPFIDKVNEKGKAVKLSIKYVGGPEVFPPFEGIESLIKGVFDVAYMPPAYFAGVVPEALTTNVNMYSPWESRERGTVALLDKFMTKKGFKYLAWPCYPLRFQNYIIPMREKPDLTGLVLRGSAQYVGFIEALGGKMIVIPAGEVYTALERGMVQGLTWPEVGIADYGWHKFVKYIWGPPFFSVEAMFIINLDKWNALHKDQQAFLGAGGKELEYEMATFGEGYKLADRKALLAYGLKEIRFTPEEEAKYVKMSYDDSWKYFLGKAPAAAELRPLMTK
jgi:TRAP-type C4-dicarboxylate transport system substrate-binding protein